MPSLVRFLVLVVLATTIPVAGSFAEAFKKTKLEPGVIWSLTCGVEDRLLVFEIDEIDPRDQVAWKGPEFGPIPLSMDEAIAIARSDLQKYVDESAGWLVDEINLQNVRDRSFWFYTVDFVSEQDPSDEYISIPVLLSGRTITGSWRD